MDIAQTSLAGPGDNGGRGSPRWPLTTVVTTTQTTIRHQQHRAEPGCGADQGPEKGLCASGGQGGGQGVAGGGLPQVYAPSSPSVAITS